MDLEPGPQKSRTPKNESVEKTKPQGLKTLSFISFHMKQY